MLVAFNSSLGFVIWFFVATIIDLIVSACCFSCYCGSLLFLVCCTGLVSLCFV